MTSGSVFELQVVYEFCARYLFFFFFYYQKMTNAVFFMSPDKQRWKGDLCSYTLYDIY